VEVKQERKKERSPRCQLTSRSCFPNPDRPDSKAEQTPCLVVRSQPVRPVRFRPIVPGKYLPIHGNPPRTSWSLIERPQGGNKSPSRDILSSLSREVTVSSPNVLLNDSALRRTRSCSLLVRLSMIVFLPKKGENEKITKWIDLRRRPGPEHASLVSMLSQTTRTNRTQTQLSTPGYLDVQNWERVVGQTSIVVRITPTRRIRIRSCSILTAASASEQSNKREFLKGFVLIQSSCPSLPSFSSSLPTLFLSCLSFPKTKRTSSEPLLRWPDFLPKRAKTDIYFSQYLAILVQCPPTLLPSSSSLATTFF
jgi:hypothetical protein